MKRPEWMRKRVATSDGCEHGDMAGLFTLFVPQDGAPVSMGTAKSIARKGGDISMEFEATGLHGHITHGELFVGGLHLASVAIRNVDTRPNFIVHVIVTLDPTTSGGKR